MSLKQFLRLLREQDGITVQFSHLGYCVTRHGQVLDSQGKHRPNVRTTSPLETVYRINNMYCSLAVASAYCSPDLRSVVGDVLATLRPGGSV